MTHQEYYAEILSGRLDLLREKMRVFFKNKTVTEIKRMMNTLSINQLAQVSEEFGLPSEHYEICQAAFELIREKGTCE